MLPKLIKAILFVSSIILIVIYRLIATPEMFDFMVAIVVAGYILIAISVYIINEIIRYWLEIYFRTIDGLIEYYLIPYLKRKGLLDDTLKEITREARERKD